MVMSWIYTAVILICILSALLTGNGPQLSAAVIQGAQSGLSLAISIGGAIILWSGAGHLMEKIGITEKLSKLFFPVLSHIFPSIAHNNRLRQVLSANICANLLGLGNAATPMGIQAVKYMKDSENPTRATPEMCRLIILNTASIQLIPTSVAALRSSLGASAPFDILPAVWITSFSSAGVGLLFAWIFERTLRHD